MRQSVKPWRLAAAIAAGVLLTGALIGVDRLNAARTAPIAIQDNATVDDEGAKLFETQVAPLLASACLDCHDRGSQKGGIDLSTRETTLAGGLEGVVLVPGDPDQSELWLSVEDDSMPFGRDPLSDDEKQALKRWIELGAPWTLDEIESPVNAKSSAPADLRVQRLTVTEYIETVRMAVGVDIEEDARRLLPRDQRADGFSNTAYNQTVDLGHIEALALLAELIVARMDVEEFASRFTSCDSSDEDCMRQRIDGMGRWLLRGPLDDREIQSFLTLSEAVLEDGGDFAEATEYVVEAMLQSPRFIYRIEAHRGDGSMQPVSDFELASRLSYILWGGPPDEELYRAADRGELSDRSLVAAQVQRMLRDPRAIDRGAQFLHEWLYLDQLDSLNPNSERFPSWNDQLAADMKAETLAFFREVAWERNRPLWELLNAQVTYATPQLAEHYGLDPKLAGPSRGPFFVENDEGDEPAPGPRPRITEGLVAHYRFDEGEGDTVRDSSGHEKPINLKIGDTSAVYWNPDGLEVSGSTAIATDGPPKRLIEALKSSKALTVEAWVTPASAQQDGPARIVTLSKDGVNRNLTIGQDGDLIDARLRTTKTNANGLPGMNSAPGSIGTSPVHVAYSRDDSGNATLYVDGEEAAQRKIDGDFSNWDDGFRLALANEFSGDRPWKGTYHEVAIYDRALSADQIQVNRASAEPEPAPAFSSLVNSPPDSPDLLVRYMFDEGEGTTVRDRSGANDPIDLSIADPSAVEWTDEGLQVNGRTLIVSQSSPARLTEAITKSEALTIEAWITPANLDQDGPARIVTFSPDISRRNFTVGQDGNKPDVRLRTSKTDANGSPSLSGPSGSLDTRPMSLVYTLDSGRARLYLDGQPVADRSIDGDLSAWDDGFRLALANEVSGERPWRGTLHRVSIYARAFDPVEIRTWAGGDPKERSSGARPIRFDLADVPGRGGLLTQGSTLVIGGDEASMVARGLFVLNDLLDSRVGNPPPCVDATPQPSRPGLSQRSVAEGRVANPSCGGCHSKFEPLAYGLEKFDGIGGYHDVDEFGNELREDGEILFPGNDRPTSFETSAELMDLLAGSDRVRKTMTRKVVQFAIGRPLVENDSPILDQIHSRAMDHGGTYASLMEAIVLSDLVQMTPTESQAEESE